jgi:hypothetical protein
MTGIDEVWDLSEPDPGDEIFEQYISGSSPEDSKLNRQLQKADSDHKRAMELAKAEFEREMELTKAEFEREIERHRVRHDRWTNYGILAIVSLLFLVSVAVLSVIAYQVNNHNTLRDKAITLLAPLTGLALGFLSGKIKWPAL